MVFKDNKHLCDDGDNCHGEDGIIWERSYVTNHAYDLVRFTKLCFRYESEFTYRKGVSFDLSEKVQYLQVAGRAAFRTK
jgi:hypothetical protein